MIHFRSRAEIADLPIWIHSHAGFQETTDLGTKHKLGDIPNLIGALDVGSCYGAANYKADAWVHEWTNTGVFEGFPTGITHISRTHLSKTYAPNEFAMLALVFDYPVFDHSFGADPIKTYTSESARLNDITLARAQEGFVFKQVVDAVTTYWILLKISQGDSLPEWSQLKEPLPAKKGAYVSVLGGIAPLALFVGTVYTDGKFTDAFDPDYPTYLLQDMLPIGPAADTGNGYYTYDPPVIPEPTNVIEQLGKTVKFFGTGPRILVRFNTATARHKHGSTLIGFLPMVGENWLDSDRVFRRQFPTGMFPNPDDPLYNDSWYIRTHTFPAFQFAFPSRIYDNDGNPYPYVPGLVNAGLEGEFTGVGVFPDGELSIGYHIDYLIYCKLDMDKLAQEDPDVYPPADPARYIRELNPMR